MSQPSDTRWNDDGRPGGDATIAAPSLARVWRGYILCTYRDNNPKSEDLWTTIYDPYPHDRWIGSQKIPFQGGTLTSGMPPVAGYFNLNVAVITGISSKPVMYVIPYPTQADQPDDFKKFEGVWQGSPMGITDCETNTRPALVNFNGNLVFAYRTMNQTVSVAIGAPSGSNVSWRLAHPTGIGNITDGPSLAVFNGQLFCAFTSGSGQVMIIASSDGVSWSAAQALPVTSDHGPAISADPLGQKLMLMCEQKGSQIIQTLDSSDGHSWQGPSACKGTTQNAPALIASTAGLMLAVYRGTGTDQIYYVTTRQGTWSIVPDIQPATAATSSTPGGDRLQANQSLIPGQSITSADGRFQFILQGDGNLVLYGANHNALWASKTNGHAVGKASMQTDGNFVIYDPNNKPLWAAGTEGHNGAMLIAQTDGNVVIYDVNKKPLWATNTAGSATPAHA